MSIETYNVLVDFTCSSRDIDDIADQFAHAIHTEEIGRNQYQVGFGVEAPNPGEAYRRGVNATEASMLMLNAGGISILSGTVYGPDDTETTFD